MFTFAKFCRLCLKNSDFLVNYTEKDYDNVSSYDKMKKIIPEMVNEYCENFPRWICGLCREELNQYYVFHKKCLNTYELLKKYKNQLNSKIYQNIATTNTKTHSLPDKNNKNEFSLPPKNVETTKGEKEVLDIFDDDTKSLNENSMESNITITKNEIPVTENEELNFKSLFKSILKNELNANTSNIIDDNMNNQLENINDTVEVKQEIILHNSTNITETIEVSNQSIINNDVSSGASEDILETSQNIETEDSSSSILKNALWAAALKAQSEERVNRETENIIETSLDKTVASLNQSNPVKNTGNANNAVKLIEKSPITVTLFTDEQINIDKEKSNSPKLNLLKRKRSDEDNNDCKSKKKFDNSNNLTPTKKVKYTYANKKKSNPTKILTSNSSLKKNITQTDNQIEIDLIENPTKHLECTSSNNSKLTNIDSPPLNSISFKTIFMGVNQTDNSSESSSSNRLNSILPMRGVKGKLQKGTKLSSEIKKNFSNFKSNKNGT